MMRNIFILSALFFMSCSNVKNGENIINVSKDVIKNDSIVESLKDNAIIDNSLKTNDINSLFTQWENKMLQEGIFDYVTLSDCDDLNKMMDLYEKGFYPMHIESKTFAEFDYNKDGVKDYVVNYTLMNCVRGNGWSTDFMFFTSEEGSLEINEDLTLILKQKFYQYVQENYFEDAYVYWEKGFLVTKNLTINRVVDDLCYGKFSLLQDGSSCCPQISGNFTFNLDTNAFEVSNVKTEKY